MLSARRDESLRWVAVGVGVLLSLGLLSVGLVHPVPLLAWALGAAGLLVAAAVLGEPGTVRWTAPAALLGCLAIVTALQLLPLPRAIVEVLSPVAVQTRTLAAPALARSKGWIPLTLDVPGTATELVKFLAYTALALAAGACSAARDVRPVLVRSVAGTGLVFALVAVIQTLLRSDRVLFFYGPQSPTIGLVHATIVNSNNIAGVLVALCPITLALGLGQEGRTRHLLFALGTVEAILAILTLSQGGIVACFVGISLLALARRSSAGRRRALVVPAAVLGAVAALGLVIAPRSLERLLDRAPTGVSFESFKLGIWRDVARLAGDYWVTGCGRGAFAVVFPRYRTVELPAEATFHFPENLPLQVLTEWGALAGGATLVAIIAMLVRAWSERSSGLTRTGALAGLTALLLHNLVDFSLEVPAVMALAVVLASLASPHRAARSSAPLRGRSGSRLVWGTAVAALALPLVFWPTIESHSYRADSEALLAAMHRPARRQVSTIARNALRRHPADYALPLLLGEFHARRGEPEALRWLNRALFLNPRGGAIHLSIARALARGGLHNQALLEFRLAQGSAPLQGHRIAELVVARYRSLPLLRRYIGTGRGSAARGVTIAEALKSAHDMAAYSGVCDLLSRRKERVVRHIGLVGVAESGPALHETQRSVGAARRLAAEQPDPGHTVRFLPVLARAGHRDEADRILSRELDRHPDHIGLLDVAARAALERRDAAAALRWVDRLRQASGTDSELAAHALFLEGQAHLSAGRAGRALASCELGQATAPESPELLRCIGDAAFTLGNKSRARSAYRELEDEGHGDDVTRARLRDL